MKITKSELREMIREALREELARSRSSLKESVWYCFFDDREVGTVEAATEEEALEKMMQEYPEHPYGLYDGCFWVEPLNEAAFSGGMAGDNSFSGGTIRGCGGSTQPKKNTYLSRIKSKNPDLVDTMILKGQDIKPNMITQYGQVKTAEVKYSDHYGKKMLYLMHTNNYDGFFEPDKEMEVMVDPDNKSKPFTGDYHDLLKKGLKESVNPRHARRHITSRRYR